MHLLSREPFYKYNVRREQLLECGPKLYLLIFSREDLGLFGRKKPSPDIPFLLGPYFRSCPLNRLYSAGVRIAQNESNIYNINFDTVQI